MGRRGQKSDICFVASVGVYLSSRHFKYAFRFVASIRCFFGACAGLVTLTSHNIVLTGSKNNQETLLKFPQTFSRCTSSIAHIGLQNFNRSCLVTAG